MSLAEHIKDKVHSAPFLDEQRDHWWNRDFLELMARRLQLDRVHSVLDVGCGLGHWGRALGQVLPRDAQVTGIDRERVWIEEARARTSSAGDDRFQFEVGSAERLPFAEDVFDLVTCQTVLIYMHDPEAVIAEMVRVTRPGGIVLCVEPNNLSQNLVFSDKDFARFIATHDAIDEVLQLIRFELTIERGRQAKGHGFNSIGDFVPGYFAALGLDEVQTYLSDKSFALYPPNATALQRAVVRHYVDCAERRNQICDRSQSFVYYLAGGGQAAEFDPLWNQSLIRLVEFAEDLDRNAIHTGAGTILYLASARKPYQCQQARSRG
jgi:ubiquinone/menaquinone biosynthesis C-methylase UbiE